MGPSTVQIQRHTWVATCRGDVRVAIASAAVLVMFLLQLVLLLLLLLQLHCWSLAGAAQLSFLMTTHVTSGELDKDRHLLEYEDRVGHRISVQIQTESALFSIVASMEIRGEETKEKEKEKERLTRKRKEKKGKKDI